MWGMYMKDESGGVEEGFLLFMFIVVVLMVSVYTLAIVVKWTLIFGAIGAAVYFLIKKLKSEIDADLRKVLAQVEGQEPIEVSPALSTTSVGWQESVLTGSEWCNLAMTFVRDTEDGRLYTKVSLEQERAIVRMFLNDSDGLVYLDYVSSLHGGSPPVKRKTWRPCAMFASGCDGGFSRNSMQRKSVANLSPGDWRRRGPPSLKRSGGSLKSSGKSTCHDQDVLRWSIGDAGAAC